MKRVLVSDRARSDVLEIVELISPDQPAAAHRLLDEILDGLVRLGTHPEIGRSRESAAYDDDVRIWVLPRFRFCIIVYRVQAESVEVLRVFHAARDIDIVMD